MLSWFRSSKLRAGEAAPAHAPRDGLPDAPHTPSAHEGSAHEDEVDGNAGIEQAVHAPASPEATPHDYALAGINARLHQIDEANRGRRRQGTLDTASEGTSQFQSFAGSTADTPRDSAAFTEPVYDPFTGKPIGVLSPLETGFEPSNDQIWSQLARIRDLQTDLALLHDQMERKHGEEKPVAVDDTAELEEDFFEPSTTEFASKHKLEARVREQQFQQLAHRFQEKKRDIESVMGKLHALANTVQEFHDMPAPSIRFPANTGSSAGQLSPGHTPPRVERRTATTNGPYRSDAGAGGQLHDSPSSTMSLSPIAPRP